MQHKDTDTLIQEASAGTPPPETPIGDQARITMALLRMSIRIDQQNRGGTPGSASIDLTLHQIDDVIESFEREIALLQSMITPAHRDLLIMARMRMMEARSII